MATATARAATIGSGSALRDGVEAILGPRGYLHKPEDLSNYEYDGSIDKARPDLVAFPQSTAEVVALVKLAASADIPVTGRGAGTGLSGGAIAREGGLMISFARMNRILEIDLANERAVVEPGVGESGSDARRRSRRLFLRARSLQPARLHHRRKRQRKFRRSAHAGLRRHHQSRAGARSRAARWHA